jgi:hypothetical protein
MKDWNGDIGLFDSLVQMPFGCPSLQMRQCPQITTDRDVPWRRHKPHSERSFASVQRLLETMIGHCVVQDGEPRQLAEEVRTGKQRPENRRRA